MEPVYDDDGNFLYMQNTGTIIGGKIAINDNPDTPFNTVDSENTRAITILHELGHLMNFLWGDDATWFVKDGNDLEDGADRSAYNDILIRDNCL